MNLTQLRDNIIDGLKAAMPAGVQVTSWEDRKTMPPVAVVIPGVVDRDGPVTVGMPYAVHYVVQIIAGKGTGRQIQVKLDTLIEAGVLALDGLNDPDARLVVDEIRGPLTGENDEFLGAEIELTAAISMRVS
ncbi:hypothetical protein [Rhodococcus sp. SORGH_AS_0303]|uniref:hypothetical protein n=1 Tax=Rhodococcus sp. SORGH_AS_0303 TaxID=3041753 RepID=UPI002782431E|nr:hypothetical protein [Rhodococcus sp. SORGH_AS_0303]MDQ1202844.1 hypothetical protein [Rhodococcus sp. SORGH_AS_0303]